METIKQVKRELKHRRWVEEIAECQSSGMKIKEWCQMKGISCNTYYSRLRIVRTELLEKADEAMQKIVPISVSTELSEAPVESQPAVSNTSSEKVVMRKDGIEIELPQSIPEDTILALLRGLKQC